LAKPSTKWRRGPGKAQRGKTAKGGGTTFEKKGLGRGNRGEQKTNVDTPAWANGGGTRDLTWSVVDEGGKRRLRLHEKSRFSWGPEETGPVELGTKWVSTAGPPQLKRYPDP